MTISSITPLGHSGLLAPSLWLGTLMFGDQTSIHEAHKIMDHCRENNLRAIDTGDMYVGGTAETMLGELIASDRDQWIVATKVGNSPAPGLPNKGLSRRWIMQAIDHSLSRLDTDWIDIYYMHVDDESTPPEETLSTIARLIDNGKIRYYGLSNFRAWRIAHFVETAKRMGIAQPIVCQPPYSAATRLVETELLPCCNHYGLGVLAYAVLARGVLTGKYNVNQTPDLASRAGRGDKRIFQTEFRPESLTMAQRFAEYARSRGLTPTQLAVAWVLNNRLVHGVIAGPKNLSQWQEYASALSVEFTDDDESIVSAMVPPGYATSHGYNDPKYPLTGRLPRNHQ